MSNKTKKEIQDEWVKLVHEGSCCAYDDPMKEEKKAFINSLDKPKEVSQTPNKKK